MTEPRRVTIGDGVTSFAEDADVLFDAVAEARERGLTWLDDADGKHLAAVVAPEYGQFVELLWHPGAVIEATLIHPDGTRDRLGAQHGPEPERRPWQEAGGGWQSRLDPPSSRSEE